jgi:anthranilate 1,2-dioxygenase small subunit
VYEVDRDALFAIEQLNKAYARCLDDDRLEDWPGFFVEDGRYLIQSRENRDAGLYGYILYFENGAMMRDRVTSLRVANYYNLHTDRHLITNVDILGEAGGIFDARANYAVIQTDAEGRSELFSAGEYHDKVVFVDGAPRFKERLVLLDTANIVGLLAVPL